MSCIDVPDGFPSRAEARLIPAAAFISGGRNVKRGCRLHVLSGKNESLCVQERKSREGTSSQPSSVICFLQFSGQTFYAAFSAIVEKDSRHTKILLSRRLFAGRFQICARQVLPSPWQGGDAAAALAGGGLCPAVFMYSPLPHAGNLRMPIFCSSRCCLACVRKETQFSLVLSA